MNMGHPCPETTMEKISSMSLSVFKEALCHDGRQVQLGIFVESGFAVLASKDAVQ